MAESMSTVQIVATFETATSRTSYLAAERAAAKLAPRDQLHVIDALRAARERLGLRFRVRDINTGRYLSAL